MDRRLAIVVGVAARRRRARHLPRDPDRPLLRPLRLAGRRRSSRARRRSATRSLGRPDASAMRSSRTSCRSRRATAVPRGLLPFPPLPAHRCSCRSWRSGASPPTTRRSSRSLAAVDVAICWWMLGRLRVRAGRPPRDDDVLRLRDGLLVHGPARHDVVLGPHRRGRPVDARGRAGARRGPGGRGRRAALRRARRRRAGSDAAAARDRRLGARPLRDRPPPVPRRPAVRARVHGTPDVVFAAPFFVLVGAGGSWWRRELVRRARGRRSRSALLLAYNVATTGHVFHPAYDYLYQLEARAYSALGYHPDWSVEDPRYLAPEPADHVPRPRPTILPERLPRHARHDRRARVHRAGADARPVRRRTARSPCRATSG